MSKIHPTAIIEDGATLGSEVAVGAYSHIGPQVKLGDGCTLHSHVVLCGNTTIGEQNVFHPFAYVGGEPQDLKYHGEDTQVIVGDHNTFREGVSVHRGTEGGGGRTTLGSHNLLMGYVHVAHDCHIGSHNVLANYTGLSGHVTVEDYVTLGGQNGVAQFLRIGAYAFTGGASLIDGHVAPYVTGYGNRFEVKGVNIVGLKRRGFSQAEINNILESHRIYFRGDLKADEAIRIIEETFGDMPEVRRFLDFVSETKGSVKR